MCVLLKRKNTNVQHYYLDPSWDEIKEKKKKKEDPSWDEIKESNKQNMAKFVYICVFFSRGKTQTYSTTI